MLLNFSVENWMSFRDFSTFSMIGSRERQHNERVPRVNKYSSKVLPVAAIYGGNASGKTCFFKALQFVRDLVITNTQPESLIKVVPYKLDKSCQEKPTQFVVEMLIDECIWELTMSLNRHKVLSEKLTKITSSTETLMYERNADGSFYFSPSVLQKPPLMYAADGTRDNQLFLSNSVMQKIDEFKPIWAWFRSLALISPSSVFTDHSIFTASLAGSKSVREVIGELDTGIWGIEEVDVPIENIPESLRNLFVDKLQKSQSLIMGGPNGERYRLIVDGDNIRIKKTVTYHQGSDGSNVRFELHQESDGSLRLLDLVPAFLAISIKQAKGVVVIDELDRSLHSMMSMQLISSYLSTCSKESRAQLIFTTHDLYLMDQSLLRRDEMWVTERRKDGCSSIGAFSDFKEVRYDKDIRKSYLQGRMGGVPKLRFADNCHQGDE